MDKAELAFFAQPSYRASDKAAFIAGYNANKGTVMIGFKPTAHDWTEDFEHENGMYHCKCITCKSTFVGHKRRIECKVCAAPILEFQGEYRWLSNFAPVDIDFRGHVFPSVEHAYVAAKFGDTALIIPILDMTAGQAKRYGRNIVLPKNWHKDKVAYMTDFLKQKYEQEPYRSKLIATGGVHIEEGNHWGDTFWGVCDGIGRNILGKTIMNIRLELQLPLWKNRP